MALQNWEQSFQNKKVTIMGLGVSGGGIEDTLFFLKQGAHVTVTDLKTEYDLKESIEKLKGKDIKFHLGEHIEQDFQEADLVIQNPSVPNNSKYLSIAKNAGVRVEMGSGIFAEIADMSRVIGITGTKGKSTTSALIHKAIKTKYRDIYLAGDVEGPPLKFIEENQKGTWGVMELSSWRLEGMKPHKKSPTISVITNIAQDHLNRYEKYEDYVNAKKIIVEFQNKDDIAVLNSEDENIVKHIAPYIQSEILWFSDKQKPNQGTGREGCYKSDDTINYFGEEFSYSSIKTKAVHNPSNIMATLTVAHIFDIPLDVALGEIEAFEGLFGRLQLVKKIDNIFFYNDTAATNPYATTQSINTFPNSTIALIVGGEDKEMDYKDLALRLKNVSYTFVIPGTGSKKLMAEAKNIGIKNLVEVPSLEKAVNEAYEKKPDVVLFSPASASFNMFKNEFDRGEKFIEIVGNLKK